MTTPETFADKVRIYADIKGEWRWQALAGNNKIVAESGEGYKNKQDAEEAVAKLFPELPTQ